MFLIVESTMLSLVQTIKHSSLVGYYLCLRWQDYGPPTACSLNIGWTLHTKMARAGLKSPVSIWSCQQSNKKEKRRKISAAFAKYGALNLKTLDYQNHINVTYWMPELQSRWRALCRCCPFCRQSCPQSLWSLGNVSPVWSAAYAPADLWMRKRHKP